MPRKNNEMMSVSKIGETVFGPGRDAARATEAEDVACATLRVSRLSLEILRDLGMSRSEIAAYFLRFRDVASDDRIEKHTRESGVAAQAKFGRPFRIRVCGPTFAAPFRTRRLAP